MDTKRYYGHGAGRSGESHLGSRPWNTDIVDELSPAPCDIVIYTTRYSGFYATDLDAVLRAREVKWLIVTGATTSVCVE